MQFRLFRVKFAGYSAYYVKKDISREYSHTIDGILVVNKKGEREQTSEGVWNSRSSRLQCIWKSISHP